jgi:hypothetical protein
VSDKDVILNNLHSIVGEVEWEMVKAIIKDDSECTTRAKYVRIPVREDGEIYDITIRVTIEYEI